MAKNGKSVLGRSKSKPKSARAAAGAAGAARKGGSAKSAASRSPAAARSPAKRAGTKASAAPAQRRTKATAPKGAKARAAAGTTTVAASASARRPAAAASTVALTARRAPAGKKVEAPVRARKAAVKADAKKSEIVLPADYRPSDDEPFMSERQRIYFRNKLLAWKEDILRQNRETLQGLHEDTSQHADLADRATSETDKALELRARDRQRKLVAKIDAALARIEEGTYGYCEESGEPISLKRLDARPIATLSLEAQERHERRERVFRDE